MFTERNEEVCTGIRINNGLERNFRFMHLQGGIRINFVRPGSAEKVTDHRDIRIENL